MAELMDAIVIPKFGGPEVLEYQRVPKPTPTKGDVLIRVKAFGLNHAEMHMRKGEWDEWNPITGLEAVGVVEACPGGEVDVGSKVIGVMGGIGRNRPGGYGEFVNVPPPMLSQSKPNSRGRSSRQYLRYMAPLIRVFSRFCMSSPARVY